MIKKIILPLFLALASLKARADNIIVQGNTTETAVVVTADDKKETTIKEPEVKRSDNYDFSLGYSLQGRDSDSKTFSHSFPFGLTYKFSDKLRLGLDGSANIVRKKEMGDDGIVNKTGYENVSAGPKLELRYPRVKFGLSTQFHGTNSAIFETTGEEVSSVGVGVDTAVKVAEDLSLVVGLSEIVTIDGEANQTEFYGGLNKRLENDFSVYGTIRHNRDDGFYNNKLTYGAVGINTKENDLTINLEAMVGQRFGGSLYLETPLRNKKDVALRLGLEGSADRDNTDINKGQGTLSFVFYN